LRLPVNAEDDDERDDDERDDDEREDEDNDVCDGEGEGEDNLGREGDDIDRFVNGGDSETEPKNSKHT
ncbi:hypothetical protein BGZ65_010346, partial [Modicella reniformis]